MGFVKSGCKKKSILAFPCLPLPILSSNLQKSVQHASLKYPVQCSTCMLRKKTERLLFRNQTLLEAGLNILVRCIVCKLLEDVQQRGVAWLRLAVPIRVPAGVAGQPPGDMTKPATLFRGMRALKAHASGRVCLQPSAFSGQGSRAVAGRFKAVVPCLADSRQLCRAWPIQGSRAVPGR